MYVDSKKKKLEIWSIPTQSKKKIICHYSELHTKKWIKYIVEFLRDVIISRKLFLLKNKKKVKYFIGIKCIHYELNTH